MSTKYTQRERVMTTLSYVMKANAISCIVFGLIFLIIPSKVIMFLSADIQPPVLLILGVGLIINGLHLTWASLKPMPSKALVLYFSIGDYIWVLGSISLVLLGIWITTTAGILTTLVVSAMVGLFGVLQMLKRKGMGDC